MYTSPVFFFASVLYKRVFPVYKFLYFIYKNLKERNEIKLYKKFIKKGATVLDIGSNIGFHTILFSNLVGNLGKVLSFEPERLNYKHLKNSTERIKNVTIYPYAVGKTSKKVPFYISKVLNVQHQTYPTKDNKRGYIVKQVSIDDFFPTLIIDFIKIDIQGAEYLALKGMSGAIGRSPDIVIMMEMEPRTQDEAQVSPKKILSFIRKLGLNTYTVHSGKPEMISFSSIKKYSTFSKYRSDTWVICKKKLKSF